MNERVPSDALYGRKEAEDSRVVYRVMISHPLLATAICPVSTEQLEQVADELLRRSDKGLLESEDLEGDFPPVTVAGLQSQFGGLITTVDGIGPFRTLSG